MTLHTENLSAAGVSIWLDDLSRDRLKSGNLKQLIADSNVVGVTTNPSIFASALSDAGSYSDQFAQLAMAGVSAEEAIFAATTQDVRDACDLFAEVYASSSGRDGRVSIEVSPLLAHDTEATIAEAVELWQRVDRPNALIKIPATEAGLEAVREVIGRGISVNVTLIFSLKQYETVIDAYLSGLEIAKANGVDLSTIHSVASFFVSRVDTEVDKRLNALNSESASQLKGQAALANARLAYEVFEESLRGDRMQSLRRIGANLQRPLWASTGVKDPSLPDTLYVTELVAPHTVNTMPEKTLIAIADHGQVIGDTISDNYEVARELLKQLADHNIDIDEVTDQLMSEGVEKFIVSWQEILETVSSALLHQSRN